MTEAEVCRVRAAYFRVAELAAWEGFADDQAREERPELLRLKKAWDKLNTEERAAVSLELARMVSPNDGETDGDDLTLSLEPHKLDVGIAAMRAAEYGRGRAGAKVRAPGFREAVREAAKVWVEQGNKWRRGDIHRNTNRYESYPMLAFVVELVTRALPPKAIARATLGNPPSQEEIMAAVDSQLRP